MAIFHTHFSKVQRSKGQNAICAAAYIGALCLQKVDGTRADYSKKKGVVGSRTILPSKFSYQEVPSVQWVWENAEKAEKRINSNTARRADLALPREFSRDECFAVGYKFTQELADRYGVITFINFHDLETSNPHIDLMWTTRVYDGKEFKEKTRVLDDKITGPQEIVWMRELWARRVNEILISYGETISPRSYKEQGINKLPTKHLGREMTALERKGVSTDLGNINREIHECNTLIHAEILLKTEINNLIKEIDKEKENESIQKNEIRGNQRGSSNTETQTCSMGEQQREVEFSTDRRSGNNRNTNNIQAESTEKRNITDVFHDFNGNNRKSNGARAGSRNYEARTTTQYEKNTRGTYEIQNGIQEISHTSSGVRELYANAQSTNTKSSNNTKQSDSRSVSFFEEDTRWGGNPTSREFDENRGFFDFFAQQIDRLREIIQGVSLVLPKRYGYKKVQAQREMISTIVTTKAIKNHLKNLEAATPVIDESFVEENNNEYFREHKKDDDETISTLYLIDTKEYEGEDNDKDDEGFSLS